MTDLSCDVAIIGAGTAGLAAERSARRAGATTLLIDDLFAGTTCASVGCMPSKLLIAAGDAANTVRRAGLFGIDVAEPVIDGPAVMARIRHERDQFVAGTEAAIDRLPNGVKVRGLAHFTGPTTLALEDGTRISAKAIVIATGSTPEIPDAFDAVRDQILTNETIFDLADLPASVGVVGAGPLGLELAQALSRLGVAVTVFDQGDTLAALKDKAVAKDLRAILEKEFPILLGVKLTATPQDGRVSLSWSGGTSGTRIFDRLLIAAGRPPRLKALQLDKAGLALDDHGTPTFDRDTLQCGDAAIFIAGDADHDRPVLHEASDEGTIAGRNAASFPKVTPGKRSVSFAIMFTDPPVAVIGRPPADDQVVGHASYVDQGRAKVMARNAGTVRLYAAKPGGHLVGATMCGPGVEHSGHLIAWAIQQKLTATAVLELPFYHPTYEEGLKPALREICAAVDTPTPSDRDEGSAAGA